MIELDHALEHLLRDVGLEESTILALRHCRIKDRETFMGLADAPGELRSVAPDMGVDLSGGGMQHKREFSKVTHGVETDQGANRIQDEHRSATETARRTHSDVARRLDVSYGHVRVKIRKELARRGAPRAGVFLVAGMFQAEPLDQVISQVEAAEQDRKKPDPPKQYGIHLSAALTIQTKRRYTSTLPKNLEELRSKYDVLSNC